MKTPANVMMSRPCTLLFLLRGDEILLAMKKRRFGAGKWNGAGGKVEPNESVEQALVRECQEEIGVTPTRFHKVAVHAFKSPSGEHPWENFTHTYICDEWDGEPIETEEMAPRWFKLTEIPYDEMWDDDQMWLPFVLKGKLMRTTFIFDEADAMLTADLRIVETLDDDTA